MNKRIMKLAIGLQETHLDAVVVSSWENLYYLAGIMTMQSRSRVMDPMPLLITREGSVHFFPTIAYESAIRLEHPEITAVSPNDIRDLWTKVALTLQKLKLSNGKIGLEFRNLSKYHFDSFRRENPEASVVDCSEILENQRITKDADELSNLMRASRITDRILELASQEVLRVGKTEMEAAGEIIKLSTELGAEGPSFHPQVISGKRSLLLNIPSSYQKKIKRNEIVLLDFGVNYRGYCSDTARAFFIGHPGLSYRKRTDAVHQIVDTTLSCIHAGVTASEVHEMALSEFKQCGFEGMCRHSSGHGIGLAVWEKPLLREFDHTILPEHSTLAVEQGLYLNGFGIRFEQNLEVLPDGYKPFFKFPMELIEL